MYLRDRFNRKIDYLRISLTDACNLRCIYCMPEGCISNSRGYGLTDDEIKEVIDIFGNIGLKKLRFTGGEPLIRSSIVELVKYAKDRGIEKIAITTNGILLDKYIEDLHKAGLSEVNVSIDSLNADKFKSITRGGDLNKVIAGVKSAMAKGIKVKLNAVILKDVNEEDFISLCELTVKYDLDIRFIELMPIGEGVKYTGIHGHELIERLKAVYDIQDMKRDSSNGPATYYKIDGARGRVGFISAMTNHFCSECNRIRVTNDGVLKQCLHFKNGLDLKDILRSNITTAEKEEKIRETIYNKPQSHRFNEDKKAEDNKFMFEIGG